MKVYIKSAEGLDSDHRVKIAKTTTDSEELTMLANDADSNVRYWVAQNPNTPAEVLVQLANDTDNDVRWSITRHDNAPIEALVQLANDEDYHIRTSAEEHPTLKFSPLR